MTLRDKWNVIINLHRHAPLDNWNYAYKTYGDKYDLMINTQSRPLVAFLYPIVCMSYLSHVHLYGVSDKCEDELCTYLQDNGVITLNNIIDILVANNHRPLYGSNCTGHTRYEIINGACIWYIYIL